MSSLLRVSFLYFGVFKLNSYFSLLVSGAISKHAGTESSFFGLRFFVWASRSLLILVYFFKAVSDSDSDPECLCSQYVTEGLKHA